MEPSVLFIGIERWVEYSRVKEYIHIDFAVERITRLLLPPLHNPDFSARFRIDRRPMSMSSRYFDSFFPISSPFQLSSRTQLARTVLILIYWTTGSKSKRGHDISTFFFSPFFLLVSFIKSSTYSGAGFLQRCVPVHAIGHWSPPTWNKQHILWIGLACYEAKRKSHWSCRLISRILQISSKRDRIISHYIYIYIYYVLNWFRSMCPRDYILHLFLFI